MKGHLKFFKNPPPPREIATHFLFGFLTFWFINFQNFANSALRSKFTLRGRLTRTNETLTCEKAAHAGENYFRRARVTTIRNSSMLWATLGHKTSVFKPVFHCEAKQSRLRGGRKGYCPGGVCKRDGRNNCDMFDKEVV